MERVTLLIERSGARISCLLNPERLETRRRSGLRRRAGAGGVLMGSARADDPLIATGGGITEYDLYLLFDVGVAHEGRAWAAAEPRGQQQTAVAISPTDVRELTRPIWDLSENPAGSDQLGPEKVRIVWGKWSAPGVVMAVAERLEQFDANGAPQRSWLSLRLRRVEEDTRRPDAGPAAAEPSPSAPDLEMIEDLPPPEDRGGDIDRIDMPSDPDGGPLQRLDLIAADHYGDPALASALAAYNGLDDMLRAPDGASLALPPAAVLRGYAT